MRLLSGRHDGLRLYYVNSNLVHRAGRKRRYRRHHLRRPKDRICLARQSPPPPDGATRVNWTFVIKLSHEREASVSGWICYALTYLVSTLQQNKCKCRIQCSSGLCLDCMQKSSGRGRANIIATFTRKNIFVSLSLCSWTKIILLLWYRK